MQQILYGFPFACSLAVHLQLVRYGVDFELRWVERGPARKIGTPGFEGVNAKQKVPTLVLGDGEVLTEIVGVLSYLDEVHRPVDAAASRRRLEWLSFLATELHQPVLGPAFDPATPEEAVHDARTRLLPPVLAHLEATLMDQETLGGGAAEGADAYLLWGLLLLRNRWPDEVSGPAFGGFVSRMLADDRVRAVIARERGVLSS